jgi:hypothetical protein
MLNFLIFLNQEFGDSDRGEDYHAARSHWSLAALFCLLTAVAGAYAVARLWLSTLQ